ncbi:glycosyltransferase family 2 protein [Pelagicoccus sp. SDUM812002]|uniref:glycosyltransferase family 2 protein n=1 Tax=Pelagicoccus sp. SDUM812002 TaxID=3041266 RepID=UPI00281009F4|nr:glycosyltransferase family 2 protein [Pelagicoccus sp. SDUM812002]MDQ8188161.1 glycosyltransferase family 2 protein [Pelagicoccus sp. SDUM812002]
MRDYVVIIPTYNAESTISFCLDALLRVCSSEDILVVDSRSSDATVDIVKGRQVDCKLIPDVFNHGLTREFARRCYESRVCVYLTQDAILSNDSSIEKLVEPLLSGECDIVYGRQLPRRCSGVFERFPRQFSYGDDDQIRSIEDIGEYGVHTFFCSNSFAAYSQAALDSVGGFPKVLSNEDYVVTAMILKFGGKIKYSSSVSVVHSHPFRSIEEFKRNFDNGFMRRDYQWVSSLVGPAESRGILFVRGLISAVREDNFLKIPVAIWVCCVKWAGFRVGFLFGKHLPPWLCRRLSGSAAYWQ